MPIVETGVKIAQARRELGLTQAELAGKMSVTRQMVSGKLFENCNRV